MRSLGKTRGLVQRECSDRKYSVYRVQRIPSVGSRGESEMAEEGDGWTCGISVWVILGGGVLICREEGTGRAREQVLEVLWA